jgi:hypothetical protein
VSSYYLDAPRDGEADRNYYQRVGDHEWRIAKTVRSFYGVCIRRHGRPDWVFRFRGEDAQLRATLLDLNHPKTKELAA